MRRLSLALLGPPEIRLEGAVLAFRTRRALALLSYLAVQGGVQPRDRLALLLWPESDAAHGRAMLRTTLAHLRDALGTATPHLHIERESVGFNFDADFDLDVRALAAAARSARAD